LCKFGEAEPLLLEALKVQETITPQEPGIMTKRLFELARFYSDRELYAHSLPYFARGIPWAEKLDIEASDPIAFADAIDEYALALEKTGNSSDAKRQQHKAAELRARHGGRRAVYAPIRYGRNCRPGVA
jgi:hypothetical protein